MTISKDKQEEITCLTFVQWPADTPQEPILRKAISHGLLLC